MNTTFKKIERILKKGDFDATYKSGKRFYSPSFIVIAYNNAKPVKRLGVVVSKKVGKAHRRNRLKRLVREFFRLNKSLFPEGTDTIVLANRKNSLDSYHEVGEELFEVMRKCLKALTIS